MCCTYIYLWTLGGVGATFALWRHKYLHYLPFEIAFKHLAQTNVGSKLTCLQDVFSWEWVWEWVWFCTHGRAQLFNKNGIVKDMRNMRIVSWSAGPQRVLFSPSSWIWMCVCAPRTHPLNLSMPLTVPIPPCPPGPPAIELRLRGCRIVERFVLRTVRRSVSQNLWEKGGNLL